MRCNNHCSFLDASWLFLLDVMVYANWCIDTDNSIDILNMLIMFYLHHVNYDNRCVVMQNIIGIVSDTRFFHNDILGKEVEASQ